MPPTSGAVRSASVNCRREACGCPAAFAACFASFFAFLRRVFALWRCLSVAARFKAFPVMLSAVSPEKSSVSRLLVRVCSPVALLVSTTPSRVIFCVVFAFALNSFLQALLPPFCLPVFLRVVAAYIPVEARLRYLRVLFFPSTDGKV